MCATQKMIGLAADREIFVKCVGTPLFGKIVVIGSHVSIVLFINRTLDISFYNRRLRAQKISGVFKIRDLFMIEIDSE